MVLNALFIVCFILLGGMISGGLMMSGWHLAVFV